MISHPLRGRKQSVPQWSQSGSFLYLEKVLLIDKQWQGWKDFPGTGRHLQRHRSNKRAKIFQQTAVSCYKQHLEWKSGVVCEGDTNAEASDHQGLIHHGEATFISGQWSKEFRSKGMTQSHLQLERFHWMQRMKVRRMLPISRHDHVICYVQREDQLKCEGECTYAY